MTSTPHLLVPANPREAAIAFAWVVWIDQHGSEQLPTLEHVELYSRLPRAVIKREIARMAAKGGVQWPS